MNDALPLQSTPYYNLSLPYGLGSYRTIPGLEGSAAYYEWLMNYPRFRDWYGWIDSSKMDALDPARPNDKSAWLFPIKVNIPSAVAEKHANALFGEANGATTGSLIDIDFVDGDNKKTDLCEKAKDVVAKVMRGSSMSSLQHAVAYSYQLIGGWYFRLAFNPEPSKLSPMNIRIETLAPQFVVPIYDPSNPWDLIEVHVVYDISKEDAKLKYGVDVPDRLALFHEHWTRDKYKIEIGGMVPTMNVKGVGIVMEGKNPWGFVPFIYIPHFRRMGNFYGLSHVPALEGITYEYNSALADRGDATKQQAAANYWMRNAPSGTKTRKISESFPAVVDLGTNNLGKDPPEIERFETGTVSDGMATYTTDLWAIAERIGSAPSVVWGADEGSQRSSLTLAFRTWPMTSHVNKERTFWTTAMMLMAKMILMMAVQKNLLGATPEMLDLEPTVKWPDIMPRDRMEAVNEMAIRVGGHFASIDHAVRALANGEDVQEHLAQIDEDMAKLAKFTVMSKPQGTDGVVPAANSTIKKDSSG